MKRFKDLTELEIRDLSELDFIKYINIEVAENSIAFVEKPMPPIYAKDIEKDIILYRVDGHPCIYVDFRDESEAKKVAELFNSCLSIKGRDYDYFYHVEPTKAYSAPKESLQKDVEIINRKLKLKYDEDLRLYNEYRTKADDIAAPLIKERERIIEKYYSLDRIKKMYVENYLILSEGDEEIAKRFLEAAYSLTDEAKTYIYS